MPIIDFDMRRRFTDPRLNDEEEGGQETVLYHPLPAPKPMESVFPPATGAPPQVAEDTGVDPDMLRAYMGEPPQLAIPEPAAKPTVKDALKRVAIGMIPMVGPAYLGMQAKYDRERRATDFANAQAQYETEKEQWRRQEELLRPMLLEQNKTTQEFAKKKRGFLWAKQTFPWMTDEQALAASDGRALPSPQRPMASQIQKIQLIGAPAPIPAVWHPDEQTWTYLDPLTGQQGVANITKVQAVYPMQGMEKTPEQTRQEQQDQRIFAAYKRDVLKVPIDSPIRTDQEADAIAWWEKKTSSAAPVSTQVFTAQDPVTREDRLWQRDPKTGAVTPLTLPGGTQAVPKAPALPQTTKAKVDQAWVIQQTAEQLKEKLKDPALRSEMGVIQGRVTEMDRKIGSMSPVARNFYATLKSFYALQGMLHGWRAIRVSEEFEKAIGNFVQSPEAMAAGIDSIYDTANIFIELGAANNYFPAGKDNAPQTTGGEGIKPEIKDFDGVAPGKAIKMPDGSIWALENGKIVRR